MGIILKIGLAILIAFYLRSCVTQATLKHLPDSLPKDIPNIQLPELPKLGRSDPPPPSDTTVRVQVKPATAHDQLSSTDCQVVNSSFGRSLLRDASQVQNMDAPRQWEVANNTDRTIAIVIGQNQQMVAVAFVGKQQSYKSRIPSSGLSFVVKHAGENCINFRAAGGIPMPDPSGIPLESGGFTGSFVTDISTSGSGISLKNTPLQH